MKNFEKLLVEDYKFSDKSWQILLSCIEVVEFSKHDYLLREAEICSSVYFIEKGLFKSFYLKDIEEINTAFHFEYSFVTNIKSLINNTASEYNIISLEKSTAIKIDKTKLLDAYKRSHEIETFGRKILESINSRSEELANSFRLLSPKERYEKLIQDNPGILERVTLTQIASYLGISRESLSRLRGKK